MVHIQDYTLISTSFQFLKDVFVSFKGAKEGFSALMLLKLDTLLTNLKLAIFDLVGWGLTLGVLFDGEF